jgi:hypothetical protein
VLKLDSIFIAQLSSIGTNAYGTQNTVIRDLKTRYMLWPGIMYPMYSIQSKTDLVIFILRNVKSGLYIYSSQLSSLGTNRHAIKTL